MRYRDGFHELQWSKRTHLDTQARLGSRIMERPFSTSSSSSSSSAQSQSSRQTLGLCIVLDFPPQQPRHV
ncbi:unnamed protein product [Pleuronectes platessa]|uniref:Uncharacterized protein n=1 Tax=Pleuronectes platessa TaxID=8262 RepID=A0A9N7Z9J9_PLEPL|nr:unnamed protein product [Pleuronectes platessa]